MIVCFFLSSKFICEYFLIFVIMLRGLLFFLFGFMFSTVLADDGFDSTGDFDLHKMMDVAELEDFDVDHEKEEDEEDHEEEDHEEKIEEMHDEKAEEMKKRMFFEERRQGDFRAKMKMREKQGERRKMRKMKHTSEREIHRSKRKANRWGHRSRGKMEYKEKNKLEVSQEAMEAEREKYKLLESSEKEVFKEVFKEKLSPS